MAATPQLARLQALGALVVLMTQMVASQVPASDPARQIREFFAAEWDWTMQQNPTWASRLGDRRWNDRWEDLSIENIELQYQHRREALATLSRFHATRCRRQTVSATTSSNTNIRPISRAIRSSNS